LYTSIPAAFPFLFSLGGRKKGEHIKIYIFHLNYLRLHFKEEIFEMMGKM